MNDGRFQVAVPVKGGQPMAMLRISYLIICVCTPGVLFAEDGILVDTVYVDETDTFVTKGSIALQHDVDRVALVAADLKAYKHWVLDGINLRKNGDPYIIKLKSATYVPGAPTVWVIWWGTISILYGPLTYGSDHSVRCGSQTSHPAGGISALVLSLWGQNRAIKTFHLSLYGHGSNEASQIDFEAKVQLTGWIDVFFPLSVYRKNIEQRVVKVIVNLRRYLAQGLGPKPSRATQSHSPP